MHGRDGHHLSTGNLRRKFALKKKKKRGKNARKTFKTSRRA